MTHTVSDQKIRNSTVSAFWFTLILVGLLLAALNFVHIFSASLEHEGAHHATTETTQTENITKNPQQTVKNSASTAPAENTDAKEVKH